MTDEQREWLKRRIQSLRSKQKSVGLIRQGGIQRTIDGMRQQLKTNTWNPPCPSDLTPRSAR